MQKIFTSRFSQCCLALGLGLLFASQTFADHHAAAEGVDPALQAAIDGEHRSAEYKARDQYRHPAQTLTWLGLKPDMTVVEISPSRGWYTEILAPYLKDQGSLYLAGFDRESEVAYMKKLNALLDEKLAAKPEAYGTPTVTELAPPNKVDTRPRRLGGHGADLSQRPQLDERRHGRRGFCRHVCGAQARWDSRPGGAPGRPRHGTGRQGGFGLCHRGGNDSNGRKGGLQARGPE